MTLAQRAAPPEIAHAVRLHQHKVTKMTMRPRGNYDHSYRQFGVVYGINPGPPPSVDLFLDGTQSTEAGSGTAYVTKAVAYLHSYVPSVGDVVLVLRGMGRSDSDRIVIGKVNGAASPYPLALGDFNAAGQWVQSGNAIYGGVGVPTLPLAQPGANPPVLGVRNGDYYFRTDGPGGVYYMEGGEWIPPGGGFQTVVSPPVFGIVYENTTAVTWSCTLTATLSPTSTEVANVGVYTSAPGGSWTLAGYAEVTQVTQTPAVTFTQQVTFVVPAGWSYYVGLDTNATLGALVAVGGL